MRLATSISPWWFWPISAMMKHGCCPPTQRPGHSSSSSGIVLHPRPLAAPGVSAPAAQARRSRPRHVSRRLPRSQSAGPVSLDSQSEPSSAESGEKSKLRPSSAVEHLAEASFLPTPPDTIWSTLWLDTKNEEKAQPMSRQESRCSRVRIPWLPILRTKRHGNLASIRQRGALTRESE